jgi:hypothetical protein
MGEGAVLEMAVKYRGISAKTPRHNHRVRPFPSCRARPGMTV